MFRLEYPHPKLNVCACMCVLVCVHVHVCAGMCACMCVLLCVCMHVCAGTCACMCVLECVSVCMCVCASADKARYQQTRWDLTKRPFIGLVVVGAKVKASWEKAAGLRVGAEEILWVEHLQLAWLQGRVGKATQGRR